ncbi:MAG: hypothetical protein RJB66_1997 [Pseudomonadota bacterium]|jgi:hypothetical protein
MIAAVGLSGCQPASNDFQKLTSGTKNSLICEQNFDDFNNRLYEFWINKKETPSSSEFKEQLESFLETEPHWQKLDKKKLKAVVKASTSYYAFLTKKLTKSVSEPEEKLKLLTALEIGDSGDERKRLLVDWAEQKAFLKKQLQSIELPCQLPPKESDNSKPNSREEANKDQNAGGLSKAVYGLRRAFATAYQSCHSLRLPALTSNTPDVEGIKILKESHPDGNGRKRVYGDLSKILTTHPYYQAGAEQAKCFDASKTPLIYDYGGKPFTRADNDSDLDFFSNDGSGTNVLGIDCSGFIFSAIARAGLNIAPNKALKAVSVHGISARMFKDPKNNGLSCFTPITIDPTNSLKAGDIIASNGHVVMVDQVGEDPFGLRRAGSINDCHQDILTTSGFDFIITHSSPWKEGVGINRSKVSDYLPSSENFSAGLINYAIAICKAQFNTTPNPIPDTNDVKIVRHKDSPECLTTKALALRHESCVAECPFDGSIESL